MMATTAKSHPLDLRVTATMKIVTNIIDTKHHLCGKVTATKRMIRMRPIHSQSYQSDPQTKETSAKDNFLEYIQQVDSNIDSKMQQMKSEMEKSFKEIIRNTLTEKASPEQTVQQQHYHMPAAFIPQNFMPNQTESTSAQNPVQHQNILGYQPIPVNQQMPANGLYTVVKAN